jgi:hypothetical protein
MLQNKIKKKCSVCNFPKRVGAISKISIGSKKYTTMVKDIMRNRQLIGVMEV